MHSLRELQQLVEADLMAHPIQGEPTGLYEPMNYMVSLGGKRIRPVAVLMAYQWFQEDVNEVMPWARAIEWFHNFTLIHDDIMDDAPLRRGQQTVHEKWNRNIGILSGDALLIKCYEQLMLGPAVQRDTALVQFNRVALEVCEGQQHDMDYESREAVSQAEYLNMITQKTSVLLGLAFQLGALAGGASPAEAQNLYEFGVHLGVSFQILDDWLDLFGAQAQVGKQVGGDVLAGKKTLLIIEALAACSSDAEREALRVRYASHSPDKVAFFKEYFQSSGTSDRVLTVMREHHRAARQKLETISKGSDRVAPMWELLEYLQDRQK